MMRQMRGHSFHLNVVGRARMWFMITGAVMLLSLLFLGVRGINAGLDFRGGTEFTAAAKTRTVNVQEVRNALGGAGVANATVQTVGSKEIQVETKHLSPSAQTKAVAALAKVARVRPDDVNVTDVGPKWGAQITAKAVRALIIFLLLLTIFLSVRLEPKMAGAAFIAVVHDLLVTAGIYALTGIEVTPATVIALLTILGYSLYDTVVIFDRVKDRTAQLSAAGRTTYSAAANDALNQVLARSINTSATALLPVGSLLFVGSYLLGAQTLRELALALFIGIIAGTYSSIFVATPIVAVWKEREPRWAQLRARIAARGQDTMAVPSAAPAAPAPATSTEPASVPSGAVATATPPPASSGGGQQQQQQRRGGPPPRRKKKKRRKR
jgi:preprotein translocase subunit SecF